jgi:hypothetical protein
MRRVLRWFSPWHRGYDKGYAQALRNVESGLRLSVDVASQYGQQTLDDAACSIARGLGGAR